MDLIIVVVNAAALGLLGFLWWQKKQKQDPVKKLPQAKGSRTLAHVEKGGVLHISLMEDSYEDYDLVVTDKHSYQSENNYWWEIIGDNGKAQVALEYEIDGEGEITASIQMEKLTLEDLPVDGAQLDSFDQNQSGSFHFDGKEFQFKESGEANFFRNGDKSAKEGFYFIEFTTPGGKYTLSCELGDDNDIDITYSKALPLSSIEIYSLKG